MGHPDEARKGRKSRSLTRGFSIRRTYKIEGHNVSQCVKFTLFGFNLIFWACGLLLLAVGIYASALQNSWQSLAGWSTDPAVLLIVAGTVMFFIGFCGCVGALRENICLLRSFAITLGLILALEVGGGVAAFLLQDKVTQLTEEKMTEAIQKYHSTNMQTDLDDATEAVQINFQCCGSSGPRDWPNQNRYFNCTRETYTGSLLTGCGVPPACCRNGSMTNTQCGYKVFPYLNMTLPEKTDRILNRDQYIWDTGCANAVIKWVKDNYILLGGIALGILIIQILGIILSVYMVDQIKHILKFNV